MIKTLYELYREEFKWKNPPYEYIYDRNPFDVIAGTSKTRGQIEDNINLGKIELSWSDDVKLFREKSEKYHLY